jgi:hypothetical protein
MSPLDEFAKAAMQGIMAQWKGAAIQTLENDGDGSIVRRAAWAAYEVAEAMLAESIKRKNSTCPHGQMLSVCPSCNLIGAN